MINTRLSHSDALRGIAVLLVVYIHFSYQLDDIKHTGMLGYLGEHIFLL
jgi:peptidoglycan/LPS O-acetylase OafA/YrhL